MYAFGEPVANRGIDAWPSACAAATTRRGAQVGGVAVLMSSEKVAEISTPPGAIVVKFDQLIITRPVSASTSANSLSAASRALTPLRSPFGLVAGGISNGPVHVWPKSVDR